MSSLFIINTTDYSANIEIGSYNVCTQQVYKEYTDAVGATHRRFIRNRIEGKFKIFFRKMTDFSSFMTTISTNQSPTDFTVPCTLYDTKSGTTKQINAFLDFVPVVTKDGVMEEYIEPFEIKVMER
jgi:hypothetical protein